MSLRIDLSDSVVDSYKTAYSGDCSEQQIYNDYDNDWEQQLEQQQCCFPISRVSILGRGSSATVYKSVLLHKLR
jgi:hypothetical protein